MRIEVKAYGRNKTRSINEAVGEVRLRADSEGDAEVLCRLGDLVRYPDLMWALLEISDAVTSEKITAADKVLLGGVIKRCMEAKEKQ